MSVTCAKCDCEVAMGLKKEHDCVKALRGIITQYSKIIAQQSDVIARMLLLISHKLIKCGVYATQCSGFMKLGLRRRCHI